MEGWFRWFSFSKGVTFRFLSPLVFWGSREYILTFDEGHTRGFMFIYIWFWFYIVSPGLFCVAKKFWEFKIWVPLFCWYLRKSLHVKHRKLRKSTVWVWPRFFETPHPYIYHNNILDKQNIQPCHLRYMCIYKWRNMCPSTGRPSDLESLKLSRTTFLRSSILAFLEALELSINKDRVWHGIEYLRVYVEYISHMPMYEIFTYHKFKPNVGKYSIHGAFGYDNWVVSRILKLWYYPSIYITYTWAIYYKYYKSLP